MKIHLCFLGGGFAMAAASNESGLSNYIGQELVYLNVLPPYLILIIIAIYVTSKLNIGLLNAWNATYEIAFNISV